jgi:hypothetical protein
VIRVDPDFEAWAFVRRGDVIGFAGDSGTKGGVHLHFEVARNDDGTYLGHYAGKTDPYAIFDVSVFYPPNGSQFSVCGNDALWSDATAGCGTGRVSAESTFNADADGWSCINDCTNFTFHTTGGNPGGFITAEDLQLGPRWRFSAPAKFLGDQSAAFGGVLSFDLSQDPLSAGTSSPSGADVVLFDGTTSIFLDIAGVPDIYPNWTSWSVPLDLSAPWRASTGDVAAGGITTPLGFATEEQMLTVLSSLTGLFIAGEFWTGTDRGYLDNVRVTAP